MNEKIRIKPSTQQPIRVKESTQPRLDPKEVADALGAELTPIKVDAAASPATWLAVRMELAKRLQSGGGKTASNGTTRSARTPLSDQDWLALEGIAAALATPEFAPSAD